MTPMLVLLFGVSPRTAVSSDLVASAVMKLLDVPNIPTALVLLGFATGGSLIWMGIRRRLGFPPLASVELRLRREAEASGRDRPDEPVDERT